MHIEKHLLNGNPTGLGNDPAPVTEQDRASVDGAASRKLPYRPQCV